MTGSLSEQMLTEVSAIIAARMGLDFPKARWADLERGIQGAARELGMCDVRRFAHQVLSNPLGDERILALASHLTIGETYFFREPHSFEILAQRILPELVRERRNNLRHLRIWSAGCSTGEEPYSIAITLDRVLPDFDDWRVTLLASDINPGSLRRASAGFFGDWSFRDSPAWLKERYFTQVAEHSYRIHPRIRERVTFANINLIANTHAEPPDETNVMDVIFCRNVLLYFAAEQARAVAAGLNRALAEHGWLIVGAADVGPSVLAPLVPVSIEGGLVYRKSTASTNEVLNLGLTRDEAGDEKVTEQDAEPDNEPGAWLVEDIHAEQACEIEPRVSSPDSAVESCRLLARACADQGYFDQALRWIDQAIAGEKLNAESYYLRALILEEQGAIGDAVPCLRQALFLNPEFALAHVAMGKISRRMGQPENARRHFRNALDVLRHVGDNEPVSCGDGLPAGQLRQLLGSATCEETRA